MFKLALLVVKYEALTESNFPDSCRLCSHEPRGHGAGNSKQKGLIIPAMFPATTAYIMSHQKMRYQWYSVSSSAGRRGNFCFQP